MIQAFGPRTVAGHAGAFFSFTTTKPRGIRKPLHTVVSAEGRVINHAFLAVFETLLFEQTDESVSPNTAYPVGIGLISTSDPFQLKNPLHTVSATPGFLMNQALV